MNINELNQHFAIQEQLIFRQTNDGLTIIEINNAAATASIALQGGQVLDYALNSDGQPLLWVSSVGQVKKGKAARGGIPVCWPWFGAPSQEGSPAHGYARTAQWEVTNTQAIDPQTTQLSLSLIDNNQYQTLWPHKARLNLSITIGHTLKLTLTTENLEEKPIEITEALHTYFNISDIKNITVSGLDKHHYYNKVIDKRGELQGNIQFDGEYDRVYLNHINECYIDDPQFQRRIVINKTGSNSTIVWNPATEKAASLGDITATGWQQMVCVESGNAMENNISINPGKSHSLSVEYAIKKMGGE